MRTYPFFSIFPLLALVLSALAVGCQSPEAKSPTQYHNKIRAHFSLDIDFQKPWDQYVSSTGSDFMGFADGAIVQNDSNGIRTFSIEIDGLGDSVQLTNVYPITQNWCDAAWNCERAPGLIVKFNSLEIAELIDLIALRQGLQHSASLRTMLVDCFHREPENKVKPHTYCSTRYLGGELKPDSFVEIGFPLLDGSDAPKNYIESIHSTFTKESKADAPDRIEGRIMLWIRLDAQDVKLAQ